MTIRHRRPMRITLVLALLARALLGQTVPTPSPQQIVIITDRALDGRGHVVRNARIRIDNGKIASLSAASTSGLRTIDLRGYTVLPGWIDTHVHLDSHFDRSGNVAGRNESPADAALGIANNAWLSLMAGVTTVQS